MMRSDVKLCNSAHRFGFWLIVVIALLARLPHIGKELPPFQFCDEGMWLNEVQRMLSIDSPVPLNFRSGAMSTFPVWLIASLWTAVVDRPLNGSEITVLARCVWLLAGMVGSALVFRLLLRKLVESELLVVSGVGLLLLNPSTLAYSIYWYPDHFIIFPAILFYLSLIAILSSDAPSNRQYSVCGFAVAALLSTKYTALVAVPMLIGPVTVTIPWSHYRAAIRLVTTRVLVLSCSLIVSFLGFNFGLLVHPDRFIADFKFNFNNYGQARGGLSSLLFYSWTTLASPFGMLLSLVILIGLAHLMRRDIRLGLTLVCFPALLIVSLSRSGLTVSRHTAVIIPLVTIFLMIGIERLMEFRRSKPTAAGSVPLFVVLGLLLLPLHESVRQVMDSTKPDSRVVAATWISANIPAVATIGTNEFCSGQSPADSVERKTTIDPSLSLGLDYYVLNSYWESPLYPHYVSDTDQRFFHFYRIRGFSIPIGVKSPEIDDLVPSPYQIVKTFDLDGPDIVVLAKQR